jgi:hypothetical protein
MWLINHPGYYFGWIIRGGVFYPPIEVQKQKYAAFKSFNYEIQSQMFTCFVESLSELRLTSHFFVL